MSKQKPSVCLWNRTKCCYVGRFDADCARDLVAAVMGAAGSKDTKVGMVVATTEVLAFAETFKFSYGQHCSVRLDFSIGGSYCADHPDGVAGVLRDREVARIIAAELRGEIACAECGNQGATGPAWLCAVCASKKASKPPKTSRQPKTTGGARFMDLARAAAASVMEAADKALTWEEHITDAQRVTLTDLANAAERVLSL